jgi:peptidoglycan/xylan/chitin deacetylase (PgdA/CDA1 family)
MYHDVAAQRPGVSGGREHFSVSRASFEAQLDQLADLGYRACSVEQAAAQPGTPSTVAISFDDGDAGQYQRGFPALARRGMGATFFITTDWVGRPGYVSWDGLREMKAAGMSIQSHSRSHPFLSELGGDALRRELVDSRVALDAQLGQQTQSLALPGGDPPRARLRRLLAETGYSVIATSRWGVNQPAAGTAPVWVKRCTVSGDLSATQFRRIVEGDPGLAWRRQVREATLRALRRSLGPSRYAHWRRRFLDRVGKGVS